MKNLRKIKSSKKIFIGISVSVITIIVWLAIFEIFLRFFYPQSLSPDFLPTIDRDTFSEYDSVLGWSLKPNAEGSFFSGEFNIRIKNNGQGLRINHTINPKKSKFRIAFLGDSNVWGFGVEDKNRMSEQMEKMLGNIEVINFGVSGYGTDQYYLSLNKSVLKYDPDMVITTFYPNDLIESGNSINHGYPKPYFNMTQKGLVLTNVPVPRIANWSDRKYPFMIKINFFLSHTSHAYALMKPLLKKIYNDFKDPGTITPYWIEMIRVPMIKEYENYFDLNGRIYCKMSDELKQRNISLVVVNIPHRSYLIQKELKTQLKDYHVSQDSIDIQRPISLMENLSRKCGFKFIDIYQYFRSYHDATKFYYAVDEHLNTNGHKKVAEILAENLE